MLSTAVDRWESAVEPSLWGIVDDLVLSGLGVEKVLVSLAAEGRSDRELREEPLAPTVASSWRH